MRDPITEQTLDQAHVTYRYEAAVPLARINDRESLANQARLGQSIDPATVELYKAGYLRGDEFPAIVLALRPTTDYLVLTGNHRRKAAEGAGRTTHDAYVVHETDVAVRQLLMYELNRTNGLPVPRDMAIAQGVRLVKHFGYTRAEAASRLRLPESTLGAALRAESVELRMHQLAEPAVLAAVPTGVRSILAGISNDRVLVAALLLCRDAALGGKLVQELTSAIRHARTEADQLAVVAAWRERPDIRHLMGVRTRNGTRSTARPRRTRLLAHLQGLEETLAGATDLAALGITLPDEQAAVAATWARCVTAMKGVLHVGNGRADARPLSHAR